MPALTRGFTLIEILVVVMMIGLLTAVVTLSFGGANLEHEIRGEAERAGLRIEFARSNALQRNREWGMVVEEDGYRFVELDPYNAIWAEQTERPLTAVTLPSNISLRLEAEGFELPEQFENDEDADEESLTPNLLIFSSGEVTPFTLIFQPEWESEPWYVKSDGLSRAKPSRDDEES